MFMWNWFVVPLGLPMIGLVQALGLDTLITFIVTTRVNTNPGPFWDRWITEGRSEWVSYHPHRYGTFL